MILYGDYHTHTPYSHGKGTIAENAQQAAKKGLKEIAITDHGFNHIMYGTKRRLLPAMRREIEEAEKNTGLKIYLGVEANFISLDGKIDVKKEDREMLDIILCGFHNFALAPSFRDEFDFVGRNVLSGIFMPSKKRIEKNTNAILRAIDKNEIDVITHLNYVCKTDTLRVAKAARDKGTLIELNGKRILFTDDELLEMASEKVKFIVNSDAHKAENVGETNHAIALLTRLKIPTELVVNMDRRPIFKKELEINQVKI